MTAQPTATEVRAVFADTVLPVGKYPDPMVTAFVGAFSQQVHTARGVYLWPGEVTQQLTPKRCGSVLVSEVPIQSVTSVSWSYQTGDPTVLDAGQLAALHINKQLGEVSNIGSPLGAVIDIVYVAGLDDAPADALIVCAEYVRKRCKETGGDKPRQAVPTGDGEGFSYSVPTPDPSKGRWTGIPTVDTAINAWTDYRIPGIA